jgi:hypothetical protein
LHQKGGRKVMAKDTFKIGETEKHVIVVDASIFWKHITIEVDGKTMVNEYSYSPAPKKFQFDVGTSEKHHVEISAGGFSSIKVVVDGKEAQKT